MSEVVKESEQARFAALFRGNPSYFITCNPQLPKDKQVITKHAAYTAADVASHLAGKMGLGVSPLLSDHSCVFGAIDIDAHDDAPLPFDVIAQRVVAAHMPLVMCRSRSGGAHLYVFFRKPAPARLVRQLVAKWASKLQIPGTDCIVPAADYQQSDDAGKPFITRSFNLPYLGGDDTDRFAFEPDGVTRLSLSGFLSLAERMALDPALVMELPVVNHEQAPPCVQKLVVDGIPAGYRNEALTQIAIYLRRVDADADLFPALLDYNQRLAEPPLKQDEIRKIAKSIHRRNYHYRCKVEPCRSMCDSATCVTRKYGITKNEDTDHKTDGMLAGIAFDDFCRVQHTPDGGIYQISINGRSAVVSATRLFGSNSSRIFFAEQFQLALPAAISYIKWVDFITPLIANARENIAAPELDTEDGSLGEQLADFISGRLAQNENEDKEAVMLHRARLNVAPIREKDKVMIRIQSFVRFCRDRRIQLPPAVSIANSMRKLGWSRKRLRTPSGVIPVWEIQYDAGAHDQMYDELAAPDTNSDY